MRTLKDLEDAYSFMRDPVIWDAIQMIKERDKYVEMLEALLEQRDAFIVSKDLWFEFVGSAALAGEKKEQEWD